MESFPSYDFPLWGNIPESAGLSGPGSEDLPYGVDYQGTAIEKTAGSSTPAVPFTLGVVYDDLSAGAKKAVGSVTSAISGVIDSAKSTVRNTYFYLIGGVALIAILGIVVLGASARFMKTMEG